MVQNNIASGLIQRCLPPGPPEGRPKDFSIYIYIYICLLKTSFAFLQKPSVRSSRLPPLPPRMVFQRSIYRNGKTGRRTITETRPTTFSSVTTQVWKKQLSITFPRSLPTQSCPTDYSSSGSPEPNLAVTLDD